MRLATSAAVVIFATAFIFAANEEPPAWAYASSSRRRPHPAAPAAAPAPRPIQHPARCPAAAAPSRSPVRDGFGPADWFPGDHPAMPEIVAHGKRPDVRACWLCHYPNGKGRPENAGVAGLPVAYFIQTMADFKSRRGRAPIPKGNTNLMIAYAKAMTDEEVRAAAAYFGAMAWTPWIKVVEAGTVPKTRIAGGMYVKLEGHDTEPIGDRIIEMPDNGEHTETLRDPRSGFTAYVPVGSIKKGEALVTSGAGKTTRCAVCHGADLKGLGPVPGIAGRSPSYLVRQLYDMQHGTRKGVWADLMKPVVANLTNEDMVAIAAYTASR